MVSLLPDVQCFESYHSREAPSCPHTVVDVFHKLTAIPDHGIVKQSGADLIKHLLHGYSFHMENFTINSLTSQFLSRLKVSVHFLR